MDPSLKLAFDEILKRFDEFDARMERGFSRTLNALEQRDTADELCIGGLEQSGATQLVMADNWGGWFEEPARVVKERVYDQRPAAVKLREGAPKQVPATQLEAEVVPDNWGGLFEQPAHIPELALSTIDATDQIRTESTLNSPDPNASTYVTPASIVSVAVSVTKNTPVETSPMEYQIQIQELKKPSSQATAVEDEADAMQKLLARKYKHEFVCNFESFSIPSGHLPRSTLLHLDALVSLALPGNRQSALSSLSVGTTAAAQLGSPQLELFFAASELHVLCVISGVVPADARERLSASGGDHCMLDDHVVIIVFDLDPRDVNPERANAIYAFESFHIGPVECALRATLPLGGYVGSLDDDPESSFAHFDAPLDRAVGHIAQVLAAAAALRTDAVSAADGGPLAWVETAGSAQSSCLTVCPAGERCFADVPVSALWEEEMLCSGGDFTNFCDSILIDVPVVFVRSCVVTVVNSSLLSTSDWIELQPWPPPPIQVEFVCGSVASRPTPWPPSECIMKVLRLCVNCLPSWPKGSGTQGCLRWNVWKCRTDSEIAELHPDIDNSSCVFAVKYTWTGFLLNSVEMQLSSGDYEPYFQWEAAKDAMNTNIFTTSQGVHCSAYVQNFCQELIYLGSYTRGHVTVLPVLSRGKGFKFRILNEEESHDAVLLVFSNKQDLPNAAEITDKEVHYNADCLSSTYSTQELATQYRLP